MRTDNTSQRKKKASSSHGAGLLDGEQFSAEMLACSPHPVMVINVDTSIKFVNAVFEEITGFSSSELVGRKIPYPYWPNDKNYEYAIAIKKEIRQGGYKSKWDFVNKSGKAFSVEITDKPIKVDGKLKYCISYWVDVTEREHLARQLETSNKELRGLSKHLESIREEERTRISREIHDELGQALARIKIDLCLLGEDRDMDQGSLRENTELITQQVDTILENMRRICTELRPRVLDELGPSAAIEWLAEEFQKATGIQCKINSNLWDIAIGNNISTALFRIVQEALTNIRRHSGADEIIVNLKHETDRLLLEIHDNGIGITKDKIQNSKTFGLVGMRERVHRLGGQININGDSGKGTNIRIVIPVLQQEV